MKKYILWSSLLMIFVGSTLVSCHSDIDFNNVDTTSEIEMGLALPVGSINATIKDFIGNVPNLFLMGEEDGAINRGVIVWRDTFESTKSFHHIDMELHTAHVRGVQMNVYDQLPASSQHGNYRRLEGQREFVFDLPISLDEFNNDETYERFDSILFNSAKFRSILRQSNLDGRIWNWITKVELDLGPQGRRAGSTRFLVSNNIQEGSPVENSLDNFSLNFMIKKDLNPKTQQEEYHNNVVDNVVLKAHIFVNVPSGNYMDVPQDGAFQYELQFKDLDFAAAWGYFYPTKDMRETHTEHISENWGDLAFLKTAKTPFARPEIFVDIKTQLAGYLVGNGDYLNAEALSDGTIQYASFLRDGSVHHNFITNVPEENFLDPYTSPIGAITDKAQLHFSWLPEEGHLDSMFLKMPRNISYKYSVDFDWNKTPQARITKNDSITAYADCKLPLIFDEGLFVNYTDTIRDISIGQFSIDSLVKDVEVIDEMKATDLKLVLKAQNNIQFCVRIAFRCLDKNNQIIMDPENPSEPFLLFPEDTVRIDAPSFAKVGGQWTPTKPGETVTIASMNKAQLEVFPKIKSIKYTIIVDDNSVQEAYKNGLDNIRIKGTDVLKLGIGLTAHVDAMLNFDNGKK